MDRVKLMTAIVEEYRKHGSVKQESALLEALKRMGDLNLFSLALEVGIDTDALFHKETKQWNA